MYTKERKKFLHGNCCTLAFKCSIEMIQNGKNVLAEFGINEVLYGVAATNSALRRQNIALDFDFKLNEKSFNERIRKLESVINAISEAEKLPEKLFVEFDALPNEGSCLTMQNMCMTIHDCYNYISITYDKHLFDCLKAELEDFKKELEVAYKHLTPKKINWNNC